MILIVKHIHIEGPGTLGDFLKVKKEDFRLVELASGEKLPDDPTLFKAVVVLGGPMNVYEEARYPFLKPENEFIRKVLKAGVPYLGICLGAQLLAKAAGARVVQSPVQEIGWYPIALTQEGQKDPLFKDFNTSGRIYQWHGDMFQIPPGGVLLATAQGCPHQAFKAGSNAYGLQFHVEITDKSIQEWSDAYGQQAQPMIDDYRQVKEVFEKQAQQLYQNFWKIINVKNSLSTN